MVRPTRLERAARDQRAQQLRREMSRTEWRLWYRLRSRVAEVDENIEGVIEAIADALSTFQLHDPPPTSPRTAGGGRLDP